GNFRPHILVARKGTTLQLGTNDDEADFELSGAAALSVRLTRGQIRPLELSRPGVVKVTSQANPWMTPATIHVIDHDYHAVTGPAGRFRLPAVLPGEYELVFWHEGWREEKKSGVIEAVRAQVRVKLGRDEGAVVQWTLSNP